MIEASIGQFTAARLDARRITPAHFLEIHRLHSYPLVMKQAIVHHRDQIEALDCPYGHVQR